MRFIITIFMLTPLILCGQHTVQSVPNQKLVTGSYVSNPDGILTDTTVARIDTLLRSLERQTTVQVAVVALASIGEGDVFDFAEELFNKWGVGSGTTDNGLLLLLVKDQRIVRFHTGFGLEGPLPDVVCKRIQRDHMVPAFKEENYDRGVLEGLRNVVKVLTDPGYEAELKGPEAGDISDYAGFVFFLFIVFTPIVLTVFIVKAVKGKFADSKKPAATPYPELRLTRAIWLLEFVAVPTAIAAAYGLSSLEDPSWECLVSLYLYFMFTLLHRLWRERLVIKRMLNTVAYYDIVQFLRKTTGYWVFMALVFPVPFLVYLFVHLSRKKHYRNHPRNCTSCSAPMRKLDERIDDEYLSEKQVMEETLGSVDYDVWKCESCGRTELWNYVNRFSKYNECPSCKTFAWYRVSRRTVVSATYDSSGRGEEVHACKFCAHTAVSSYTIAKLTRSSSSSGSRSSSGGSWGGGRSGGGGAGSSW